MPEEIKPQVSEQTPTEQTPAPQGEHVGEQPLTKRDEIYKKYYEQQSENKLENNNQNNQQTAPQPPQPETKVEDAPVVETPVEPVEEVENEAVTFLRGMYEETKALKQQLAEMQAKINQPSAPSVEVKPTQPVAEDDWIEALRAGDFEKAKRLVREDVKKEIQTSLRDELVSTTTANVTTLQRVEQDVMQFTNKIRADNPELTPFEPYISSVTGTRVDAEIASKGITDPVQYAEVFKRVLNEEVDKARKIASQMRAAGKTDATTVQKEILSTTTVAPNTQDQMRGALNKPEEPKFDSVEDYIKKRQTNLSSRRNL